VYGHCPHLVAQYVWVNTSGRGGSRRSGKRRKRKVGWAVRWVVSKSGSRVSRADKYGRKRIPGRPPGRHTGGCFFVGCGMVRLNGSWPGSRIKQVPIWVGIWVGRFTAHSLALLGNPDVSCESVAVEPRSKPGSRRIEGFPNNGLVTHLGSLLA